MHVTRPSRRVDCSPLLPVISDVDASLIAEFFVNSVKNMQQSRSSFAKFGAFRGWCKDHFPEGFKLCSADVYEIANCPGMFWPRHHFFFNRVLCHLVDSAFRNRQVPSVRGSLSGLLLVHVCMYACVPHHI